MSNGRVPPIVFIGIAATILGVMMMAYSPGGDSSPPPRQQQAEGLPVINRQAFSRIITQAGVVGPDGCFATPVEVFVGGNFVHQDRIEVKADWDPDFVLIFSLQNGLATCVEFKVKR